MRIFLYEYTCALANPSLPASFRAEGAAMLAAVVEDFQQLPGVTAFTLLPAGSPLGTPARRYEGAEEPAFRDLARAADFTLVIAPEFDGLLAARCRWVLEEGGRLLGPTPAAVELTGDKLLLAARLHAHGVPTPTVAVWGTSAVPFPAVCKPRHGAGSQATFLVRHEAEVKAALAAAVGEGPPDEMLLQAFAPGRPASVAFLLGPRAAVPLAPAAQHLSDDGRFRYLGGEVPLPSHLSARAEALGRRAVAAVPGLRGYVGVDLVLGTAEDGSDDRVIEINPRLTTSYVGLRRLALTNLAGAMLRAALGEEVGPLGWRPGAVRFQADGSVALCQPEARGL